MVQNHTKIFIKNEHAYRAFLTKFTDNPSFDNLPISTALEYAHKSFETDESIPARSKSRLIKTILANKQKILNDLETLKTSPESRIEPPVHNVKLRNLEKVTTQLLENYDNRKRSRDEDLTNTISKKLKLSSIRNKDVKCTVNKLRQRKNSKNKRTMLNYSSVKKNKSVPSLEVMRKIPIVVLEMDKRLQDMAKNYYTRKEDEEKENEKSSEESDEKDNDDDDSNKMADEEIHECPNETEIQKDNSLEILQNNSTENGSFTCREGFVINKQEVELMESTSQLDTFPPSLDIFEQQDEQVGNQNETACNIETEIHSQLIVNSSTPTAALTDQENMSLKIACYNNFVPPVQMVNNTNSMVNNSFMFNANSNPYMVVPMPQFQPNIIVTNPGVYNGYQGMYNQFHEIPFVRNTMFTPQNFSMMPQQQPCINQVFSPAQEIAKLQNTILNLNSQLSSIGNVLATQFHLSQYD